MSQLMAMMASALTAKPDALLSDEEIRRILIDRIDRGHQSRSIVVGITTGKGSRFISNRPAWKRYWVSRRPQRPNSKLLIGSTDYHHLQANVIAELMQLDVSVPCVAFL